MVVSNNEQTNKGECCLILVDFGHLSNRAIFANKPEIVVNPTFTAHAVLNLTLNTADKFGSSIHNRVVIAADSKPSWRHHFYTENCKQFPEYEDQVYKGNREKDKDIPWDKVNVVMNDTINALRSYSDLQTLQVPLAEADDIIAVLAKDCIRRREKCIIVSSDKDFKQCQDEEFVEIYDPIKQAFQPKINVTEFKRLHILIGDKIDNIKACRARLGEKTAEKILPVIVETLKLDPEMRKRYQFNQKLIDLDKIPDNVVDAIMEQFNEPFQNFNGMGLMKFFSQHRLAAISERIASFKLSSQVRKTKLNSMQDTKKAVEDHTNAALDAFFAD